MTASSQNATFSQEAIRAIDGVNDGYPGDFSKEWSTISGGAGSWIQLDWAAPVTINRIVLNDRPNSSDQIISATLTFSDGSQIAVGELDNGGADTVITFDHRSVTSVRLDITGVSGTTYNVGLAEFQAWTLGG